MSLLKYFSKLPSSPKGNPSPPAPSAPASPSKKRKIAESSFNAATPARTSKKPQPIEPSALEADLRDAANLDVENFPNRVVGLARAPVPQHLLLDSEIMAPDWFAAFRKEMEKPYFVKIKDFLAEEHRRNQAIYPAAHELYSFTKCALKDIKVVILGQDPYHGANQAHGLCFSVKKGIPPPPSLINIFNELQSDLGADKFTIPSHGFLEGWAEQGVLLLNAALTVRAGQAASHSNIGWATFTDAIVAYVNQNFKNIVFMLWGAHAQKKGSRVDQKKHLILKAVHPSPLSAYRGFMGCKHFSRANEYLIANGKLPIDWNRL